MLVEYDRCRKIDHRMLCPISTLAELSYGSWPSKTIFGKPCKLTSLRKERAPDESESPNFSRKLVKFARSFRLHRQPQSTHKHLILLEVYLLKCTHGSGPNAHRQFKKLRFEPKSRIWRKPAPKRPVRPTLNDPTAPIIKRKKLWKAE